MKPGIYSDIPIQEYHAGPGWSSSQLRFLLKESPYVFWHKYLNPEREQEDLTVWGNTNRPMCIGGAVAALMEEGQIFKGNYAVLSPGLDDISKNSTRFKEAFSNLVELYDKKTAILNKEYEQAQAIVEAIYKHPDPWTREQLNSLFNSRDLRAECSHYLEDDETGLLLKTRLDLGIPRTLIGDVKTTSDCGQYAWSKRLYDGGHHIQAAMALDIQNKVESCAIENVFHIVVEQQPPHDCALYYLGKPTLQLGYRQYRKAVTTLAKCLERDEWPGKVSGINEINVPSWALNEGLQEPVIDTADIRTGVIR